MRKFLVLGSAALLAACSTNDGDSGQQGETVAAEAEAPAKPGAEPLKVTLPQLAYHYSLSFLLPDARLAETQEAHRVLCDRLGPARCQLLSLTRDDAEGRAGSAVLKLRVASADATYFTGEAARQVTAAGGRALNTNVAGDDVSKDLTDTAARIHQRELLVARLTETLRTRKGTVPELIEAERTVASAQEELDKARAWQRELQGRVAMAEVEIHYQPLAAPASGASVGAALGEAVQGSASTFVGGMQFLLSLAIYLLPWGAVVGAGIALVTLLRRRNRAA